MILLESLVSSTTLEILWETLENHSRAKITLLNFVATGLADCKDTDSQSDLSLILEVLSEQNLMFLAGSFQRHSQLLLSDNAAALNVTFAAETTDQEDPNVILVSAETSIKNNISLIRMRIDKLPVYHHLASFPVQLSSLAV